MIDIHCHLLPGIDDGPPDLGSALQLARALLADGIKHVVCTPHVFPGRFENRRSNIADDCVAFRQRLREAGISLSISCAGEVRLTPEVLSLLDRDELPFLGQQLDGYRTMLLEMPDGQIPVGAHRFVERLLQQTIRPVIVHPERNRAVIDDPDRLEDFVDMGCAVQVTASSVTGHFGDRVHATVKTLLNAGWVHAVATDAHNLGGRRPRMGEAYDWLALRHGESFARELTETGPAELAREPSLRVPPARPSR